MSKDAIFIPNEDERPHRCTFEGCSRGFIRLEHLKRHIRSHTGERPFACSHKGCPKRFSRYDNMLQHLKCHKVSVGLGKKRKVIHKADEQMLEQPMRPLQPRPVVAVARKAEFRAFDISTVLRKGSSQLPTLSDDSSDEASMSDESVAASPNSVVALLCAAELPGKAKLAAPSRSPAFSVSSLYAQQPNSESPNETTAINALLSFHSNHMTPIIRQQS